MRRAILTAAIAVLVTAGGAAAGETGHYVNGVEGVKGSSLPPPGLYWRMYHAYYEAGRVRDGNGRTLDVDFDLDVYALVNRIVWISRIEALGGNLGADLIVPLIDTDLTIPPFFRLPAELQEVVLVFLQCRGNIREAEKRLKISYPTVCKKLDIVNELLGGRAGPTLNPLEVLEQVERGELTAQEAAEILKGRK